MYPFLYLFRFIYKIKSVDQAEHQLAFWVWLSQAVRLFIFIKKRLLFFKKKKKNVAFFFSIRNGHNTRKTVAAMSPIGAFYWRVAATGRQSGGVIGVTISSSPHPSYRRNRSENLYIRWHSCALFTLLFFKTYYQRYRRCCCHQRTYSISFVLVPCVLLLHFSRIILIQYSRKEKWKPVISVCVCVYSTCCVWRPCLESGAAVGCQIGSRNQAACRRQRTESYNNKSLCLSTSRFSCFSSSRRILTFSHACCV